MLMADINFESSNASDDIYQTRDSTQECLIAHYFLGITMDEALISCSIYNLIAVESFKLLNYY